MAGETSRVLTKKTGPTKAHVPDNPMFVNVPETTNVTPNDAHKDTMNTDRCQNQNCRIPRTLLKAAGLKKFNLTKGLCNNCHSFSYHNKGKSRPAYACIRTFFSYLNRLPPLSRVIKKARAISSPRKSSAELFSPERCPPRAGEDSSSKVRLAEAFSVLLVRVPIVQLPSAANPEREDARGCREEEKQPEPHGDARDEHDRRSLRPDDCPWRGRRARWRRRGGRWR